VEAAPALEATRSDGDSSLTVPAACVHVQQAAVSANIDQQRQSVDE